MLKISSKYNIYDCFIFFLIASLAAGNLFGPLQLPRVIAFLLAIPCLSKLHVLKRVLGTKRIWIALFLIFSFVSCLWTPAGISEGLVASVYNLVHVLLFIEILVFSKYARNPFKAISLGFLVALFITAVIGFWEMATDNHLSTSKLEEARIGKSGGDNEIFVRYFAAATFFNFNTYVIFICFLLPFLFWGGVRDDNKPVIRSIFFIAIAIAIVLVLFNGSRGGLLSIAIMAMVYIYYSFSKLKQSFISILLLIAALTIAFVYFGPIIFNSLIMRSAMQEAFQDESRFIIWNNVLKVSRDYLFLGCGAGGLEYVMIKYASDGVTAAHNVFLELLSEYGMVFMSVFVAFLFKLFKRARRITDFSRKLCIYQAIMAFPIIGIINSGYLTQPTLWASMASLYVFANYEQIKPVYQDLRQTT